MSLKNGATRLYSISDADLKLKADHVVELITRNLSDLIKLSKPVIGALNEFIVYSVTFLVLKQGAVIESLSSSTNKMR